MNIYIILIFIIIFYEILITIYRKLKRRYLFKKALKRKKITNKKLLVIGDPYNGLASILTGPDYSCGDLNIDLTGCPKCDNSLKNKLEDVIDTINLDDYVIYISCVLEYVDDIDKIINKINSVDPKDLFIVNVEWFSLSAYFYPYFLTNEKPPKNILYSTNPIKYFTNFIKS